MAGSAIFIAALGLVVAITACTFSIYTFADNLSREAPSSLRGRIGSEGRPGENGTCDETKADELLDLYSSLNDTTNSFNFCPTLTCDELSFTINDLESVIDSSNLRGVDLIPLASDVDALISITTNGTFCSQNTCTYHALVIAELLENFGTNNQTGLLETIASLLAELEETVNNDTFVKYPVTDDSIVNGSISTYKINGLIANSVVVTDENGVLSTELLLDTGRGGTGKNSTGWTGVAFVNNGIWSANSTIAYDYLQLNGSITNNDIASNANISRTKIAIGTPNYVVITDSNGALSEEQYLSPVRGGHGISMASASGFTLWVNGAVTQTSLLDRSYINPGTPNYVVINNGAGVFSEEQRLATTRGGTNKDSSSWNGFVRVTNGVWNVTSANLTYSDLNLTNSIVNSDISTSAAIDRSKIAAGSASHVIINDPVTSYLSSEAQLATQRGGTNKDSSSWTGYCYVNAGNWTYISSLTYSNVNFTGQIVDADISASASIQRSKIAVGTANHVLINSGTGALSSEAQLAPSRGGTGIDTSSSTGFPKLTSGVWSIISVLAYANLQLSNSIVNADISSTAAIARSKIAVGTADHVVINSGTGALSSEARLSITRGGTGQDSTGWSAVPLVTVGVWSAGITYASSTYSPALTFGNANTGIVQSFTYGKYVQFGGIIFVEVYVTLSSKGSATGQARVSLPLTTASPSTGATACAYTENVDLPANYYTVHIAPESGATTALFAFAGDNNGASIATDAHFTATSTFRFSLMYSP
jgi:hypothetical protein